LRPPKLFASFWLQKEGPRGSASATNGNKVTLRCNFQELRLKRTHPLKAGGFWANKKGLHKNETLVFKMNF
jgi:hypothetical protein